MSKLTKKEKYIRKMARKKASKYYQAQLAKREIKRRFAEWSLHVRERDFFMCAVCGIKETVHAHHILPRENHATRFDVLNGLSLCAKHHKYSLDCSPHRNPFVFMIWLMQNRSEQYNYLRRVIEGADNPLDIKQ